MNVENSNSLIETQNVEGGIRNVINKENKIMRKGQRKRAINFDYAISNTSRK